MIGTVVDVHEQKLAEDEKQKLLALIETSSEFVSLAAMDTSIEYANLAAREMLGWDTIEGRKLLDCVYPEDRELANNLLHELGETGQLAHEIRFVNEQTGEPFWLQWNGVGIKTRLPASSSLWERLVPTLVNAAMWQRHWKKAKAGCVPDCQCTGRYWPFCRA